MLTTLNSGEKDELAGASYNGQNARGFLNSSTAILTDSPAQRDNPQNLLPAYLRGAASGHKPAANQKRDHEPIGTVIAAHEQEKERAAKKAEIGSHALAHHPRVVAIRTTSVAIQHTTPPVASTTNQHTSIQAPYTNSKGSGFTRH